MRQARERLGVCLLGALFGLLTCALTVYERVRPTASAHAVAAPTAATAPAVAEAS